MLFLKPSVNKKSRELFFHCFYCYSPAATSYKAPINVKPAGGGGGGAGHRVGIWNKHVLCIIL